MEVACRERMILTSGGDFHKDTYRPICGMKLPDEITDGVALGVYLANADHTVLVIQEVDREPVELEYFRNEGRYLFL